MVNYNNTNNSNNSNNPNHSPNSQSKIKILHAKFKKLHKCSELIDLSLLIRLIVRLVTKYCFKGLCMCIRIG
jgi:hypothetical protein